MISSLQWCGHSAAAATEYEDLATRYNQTSGLIVAKIDGIKASKKLKKEYGPPRYRFPLLVFYPAGPPEAKLLGMVEYGSTRRCVGDFQEFVEKHGGFKPSGDTEEVVRGGELNTEL